LPKLPVKSVDNYSLLIAAKVTVSIGLATSKNILRLQNVSLPHRKRLPDGRAQQLLLLQ
jgi:hypothetical protein